MQNSLKVVFTSTMQSEVPATLDNKRFIDNDGNVYNRSRVNSDLDKLRCLGHAIEVAINQDCTTMLIFFGVIKRKSVKLSIRPDGGLNGAPIIMERKPVDVMPIYPVFLN